MKKLEYRISSRRDLRTWMILLVGLVFVWAGFTVPPAGNCDESGRECAPWLVPVAWGMGGVATALGLGLFFVNRKWGTRLDLAQRRLEWWDSAMSSETQSIPLDQVTRIMVRKVDDSADRIFFYDTQGELIRFTEEPALPYSPERWARDLVVQFPHITVEVA